MSDRSNLRPETASQTAGPYVHIGLMPKIAGFSAFDSDLGQEIAGPNATGERICIEGVIYDGDGAPVTDALIEIWQANAEGVYASPEDPRSAQVEDGFVGWGRRAADFETGLWSFDTVKPGRVPGPDQKPQAPHISLWITARGINIGLSTRIYFEDEAAANATDPLLGLISDATQRATLVATKTEVDGASVYRFDIHLQGPGETVFLDV